MTTPLLADWAFAVVHLGSSLVHPIAGDSDPVRALVCLRLQGGDAMGLDEPPRTASGMSGKCLEGFRCAGHGAAARLAKLPDPRGGRPSLNPLRNPTQQRATGVRITRAGMHQGGPETATSRPGAAFTS